MTVKNALSRVGIVGLGMMGKGIARVTAQAGLDVIVVDQDRAFAEKAVTDISKSLDKSVRKQKMQQEEAGAILSRIRPADDLESLSGCGLIIEAVFEDEEIKKNLFKRLSELCPEDTILATNTSNLSVTRLATGLSRIERVAGLHFFNPVLVMKLVEVVKTIVTSDHVVEVLTGFVRTIGKEPVIVRDQAGFLVNYLTTPYFFDCMKAVSSGLSTVLEIDNAMRYGCGYPMGPLALCDLIGLDILMKGSGVLFEEYHDTRYAAPPILRRLVEVGDLGRKTGRGFYDYRDPKNPQPRNF